MNFLKFYCAADTRLRLTCIMWARRLNCGMRPCSGSVVHQQSSSAPLKRKAAAQRGCPACCAAGPQHEQCCEFARWACLQGCDQAAGMQGPPLLTPLQSWQQPSLKPCQDSLHCRRLHISLQARTIPQFGLQWQHCCRGNICWSGIRLSGTPGFQCNPLSIALLFRAFMPMSCMNSSIPSSKL